MDDALKPQPTNEGGLVLVTPDQVAEYASKPDTMDLGVQVPNDWDDELYIVELYEMYLQAVEQSRSSHVKVIQFTDGIQNYDRRTEFEKWLGDCLKTLQWRVDVELENERRDGHIDQRIYANAKTLAEMSMRAIRKYLEKPWRLRLIGV